MRAVLGGSLSVAALVAALGLGAGALTAGFTEVAPAVPGGFVSGTAINDAGQSTGSAEFAGGTRGFVRDADGTYTELAPLPGDAFSAATSINASGAAVGGSDSTAVLWPPGAGPVDLGVLPGSTSSFAADINDGGWIVGTASDTGQSWYRDPDVGTLTEIVPVPGGTTVQVRAINNAGLAVGRLLVGGSFAPFEWTEAGGMELMALPDGEVDFEPTDINEAGQIIGHVFEFIAPEGSYRAYLLDPVDGYTQLTLDGYTSAFPQSLNDVGLVVGFVDNEGSSSRTPAAWDTVSGDVTAFPLFLESAFTNELIAVNDSGVAAGISREGDDFDRTFIGQIRAEVAPVPPVAPPAVPAPVAPSFTG